TEAAIVDVLANKAIQALLTTGVQRLVVAGGVGANRHLRARLSEAARKRGFEVYFPPLEFCTDNGAMIAFAAAQRVQAGLVDLGAGDHSFSIRPRWDLQDVCTEVADLKG